MDTRRQTSPARTVVITAAAAAIGVVLAACGGEEEANLAQGNDENERSEPVETADTSASTVEPAFDPATTSVVYAFTDSSVPPNYHRSFTLEVRDGQGTVVVTAYGDELDRAEAEVDPAAVEALLSAYSSGELERAFDPESSDDGCTGGRTHVLSIDDGHEQVSTEVLRSQRNEQAEAELVRATADLLEPFDIATLTDGRYP